MSQRLFIWRNVDNRVSRSWDNFAVVCNHKLSKDFTAPYRQKLATIQVSQNSFFLSIRLGATAPVQSQVGQRKTDTLKSFKPSVAYLRTLPYLVKCWERFLLYVHCLLGIVKWPQNFEEMGLSDCLLSKWRNKPAICISIQYFS